jgi:glutamate formiminotransferase/formiminotetrahydrofolate cyclodeaminase
MSESIVECVPNFSEGRDSKILAEIVGSIEAAGGVKVLDVDSGPNTNRTVVTFVGSPDAVEEAAFQAVTTASHLIDMRNHHGEHPRIGATDVLPFIPVSKVAMEECISMAKRVGERIGQDLEIPVYLYDQAASVPERRNLATIRSGEYEGLKDKIIDPQWLPDHGPAEHNLKSGATCVGAREFLIAYNINLNNADRRYANDIAYSLRERGRWKRTGNVEPFYYKGEAVHFDQNGRFPCGPCDFVGGSYEELRSHYAGEHQGDLSERYKSLGIDPKNPSGPVFDDGIFKEVKAIGWVIDEYDRAQISINLTNYKVSSPHQVLEAARREAVKRGVVVTGSELIGLIPFEALKEAGVYYRKLAMKSTGIPVPDLLETAIQSMGLRDVSPFDIEDKVIGLPTTGGPLMNLSVLGFVDEVSRETPAPGGGSVAALTGALGGALTSMVANLSVGKGEFDSMYDQLCQISTQAQEVKDLLVTAVDADTKAFDSVLTGMRMPKDSEEERKVRTTAIENGYKRATLVPLETAKTCLSAMDLANEMAGLADSTMMSDVGTGCLMAEAGLRSAIYNVRINLPNISDQTFQEDVGGQIIDLLSSCEKLREAVSEKVEATLSL